MAPTRPVYRLLWALLLLVAFSSLESVTSSPAKDTAIQVKIRMRHHAPAETTSKDEGLVTRPSETPEAKRTQHARGFFDEDTPQPSRTPRPMPTPTRPTPTPRPRPDASIVETPEPEPEFTLGPEFTLEPEQELVVEDEDGDDDEPMNATVYCLLAAFVVVAAIVAAAMRQPAVRAKMPCLGRT